MISLEVKTSVERLQKVLANAGIASRRKCEELISAGRVKVNDQVVTRPGVKVDVTTDVITVDDRPVQLEPKVYILFHKPRGVISAVSDPRGRKTVVDFFRDQIKQRIYPVGRLDYDTEGLLLLTNDGEFANALMHPSGNIPKTYHVWVKGIPHGTLLEKLERGILLEDGMTAPAKAEYVDVFPEENRSIISLTLVEGRNRQVRRMFEAISFPVRKLVRVKYGFLTLEGVARGKYRHLSRAEVNALLEMARKSHKFQKRKQD